MVIHKNTLIFKRQQNTGWKFDWLRVLNNACTKTKVIKYRKYLPKTKKIPISMKSFCVSVYLRYFFIGYFSPKKLLQRCMYLKWTAAAIVSLGILSDHCLFVAKQVFSTALCTLARPDEKGRGGGGQPGHWPGAHGQKGPRGNKRMYYNER